MTRSIRIIKSLTRARKSRAETIQVDCVVPIPIATDVPTQIEIAAADAEARGQRKTDDEPDQSTKSEVSTTIDLAASRRASRRFSGRLRDKMSNSVLPRREEAGDGEMEDVESNRPAQVNRASRLSSTESSSSGVDMSENRTGQTPSSARRQSSRSYEKRLKDKISNSISLRRVEPATERWRISNPIGRVCSATVQHRSIGRPACRLPSHQAAWTCQAVERAKLRCP